jgi:hypothetical protein
VAERVAAAFRKVVQLAGEVDKVGL